VSEAFRCSVASLARTEQLAGSASTVRAFLLVEAPGPWGVDAVRDARLPEEVRTRLRELQRVHKVRPLLIRGHRSRPAVSEAGGVRVFASFAHSDRPWTETAVLGDLRELVDLPVEDLANGTRPGLTPYDGPGFFVCTHGRHDACCAETGRPLCRAMHAAAPEHAWEVSHIGGDRFAANMLVLPHGLYYGRLEPSAAADFVARTRAGRLDLEHLRGRSAYGFSVQAAEIYLRKHLGRDEIAPFPVLDHTRQDQETRVVFDVAGARWRVRVRTDHGARRQLTCRATSESLPIAHELLGIDALVA
jgi:hypothetical protein